MLLPIIKIVKNTFSLQAVSSAQNWEHAENKQRKRLCPVLFSCGLSNSLHLTYWHCPEMIQSWTHCASHGNLGSRLSQLYPGVNYELWQSYTFDPSNRRLDQLSPSDCSIHLQFWDACPLCVWVQVSLIEILLIWLYNENDDVLYSSSIRRNTGDNITANSDEW